MEIHKYNLYIVDYNQEINTEKNKNSIYLWEGNMHNQKFYKNCNQVVC